MSDERDTREPRPERQAHPTGGPTKHIIIRLYVLIHNTTQYVLYTIWPAVQQGASGKGSDKYLIQVLFLFWVITQLV